MERRVRGRPWWPAVAGIVVMAALVLAATAAEPRKKSPPRRNRWAPMLKIGQDAPDFEIHKLTLEKNAQGVIEGKISKDTVKLSSYEGEEIVCLFSSSYT